MKFYDAIGYAESVEQPEGSGVFVDVITEKKLYGDVLRNTRALQEGDKVNNDLTIGSRFSLMADTYADENFESIRYLKWKNRRWLVTNIDYDSPPRLILTPGGVYNGPTPAAPVAPEDPGS